MRRVFIVFFIMISFVFAQNLKIFTENYPPFNTKTNNVITGSSVEVLAEIFKQINSPQTKDEIVLTNWSRAYSTALKKNNAMVFSTSKTKEREPLFKWVGPIGKVKIGLIALKSKKIKIDKVSDLNNYKIGAVLNDVGEQLLLNNGVDKKNIKYVRGEDAINISFRKLEKDRIDMFSFVTKVAFSDARVNGFDTSKYEVIYILKRTELYFAFNINTDDKIINKWQKALDIIKSNGTYEDIMEKY